MNVIVFKIFFLYSAEYKNIIDKNIHLISIYITENIDAIDNNVQYTEYFSISSDLMKFVLSNNHAFLHLNHKFFH